MTEKAYCCGNSAQREAKLISKFDLVFGFTFFLIFLTFLIVLVSSPQTFSEIALNTPKNATTDLSTFLEWPSAGQISLLSCLIILHIIYIGLAVLLFIGAAKRNHQLLLIWFITTICSYLAGFITIILMIVYLHDKIAISVGSVTVLLYKWYCLWIAKILMKEITSVSEAEMYGNPIEADLDDPIESGIPLDKF